MRGRAPGGDEDLGPLHRPAALERHGDPAALARGPLGPDPRAHVDAAALERGPHVLGGEGLLARDEPLGHLEQGDLGPQRAPGLGQLDADHATAEHDQVLGHGLRVGALAVRPGPRLGQPADRQERRRRAGREDDRAGGLEHLVAHAHAPLARETRLAAHELIPRSSSHGSWASSSQSWTTSSRRASTAAAAIPPLTPSLTPATRLASSWSSPGRSRAFEGMQPQ